MCFFFLLKVIEKTARYQRKLEEKQADTLRAIKEKESQVRAMILRLNAATPYSKSTLPQGISLPCVFFNYSYTHPLHTYFRHPLPQYVEKMNGLEGGSTGASTELRQSCCTHTLPLPATASIQSYKTLNLKCDGSVFLEEVRLIPELLILSEHRKHVHVLSRLICKECADKSSIKL